MKVNYRLTVRKCNVKRGGFTTGLNQRFSRIVLKLWVPVRREFMGVANIAFR